MTTARLMGAIAVMAAVTYVVRALPLTLFRHKLKSVFVRSFLAYIPYAVLGAMTLPAILFSTDSVAGAAAGLVTAAVLSYMERSLLTVALAACGTVFVVEQLLHLVT